MEDQRTGTSTAGPERYRGFKGTWDSRSRVFIFESREERDRWQIREYGHVRNGFRTEDEPVDERPPLVYASPQFADAMERATYEAAVAGSAQRAGEGPFSYIRRVSEIVTHERQLGVKAMPHVVLSRRQRDRELANLRGQAREMNPEGVE